MVRNSRRDRPSHNRRGEPSKFSTAVLRVTTCDACVIDDEISGLIVTHDPTISTEFPVYSIAVSQPLLVLVGTLTFHSCPQALQRYFVSTAGSCPFAASIFFRLLNM
jgi:hypothetical protein